MTINNIIRSPYQTLETINKEDGSTTTRAITARLKAENFTTKAEYSAYNAMSANLGRLLVDVYATDNSKTGGNNANNDLFTAARKAAMAHIQGMYDYLRRNDKSLPAATISKRDVAYIIGVAYVRKLDKETMKPHIYVKSPAALHTAIMDVFHCAATGEALPTAELTLSQQTALAKIQEREAKAAEKEKAKAEEPKKQAQKKPAAKKTEAKKETTAA